VFSDFGLDQKDIEEFHEQLEKQGYVLIPQIKVIKNGETRYFSLFSTYTNYSDFPSLEGLQGQFIDRTKEVLLKLEVERLYQKAANDKKKIQEKNTQLESLAKKLAKYLSPQVYDSIFLGKKDVKVETYRKKLTVFFSDIKGFTETTDNMESEALCNLLNEYLNEMSQIALRHGGTIDKFIGDAIMIFFGDPESLGEKEDAISCVKMALEMRTRLIQLQRKWQSKGIVHPLHVRMGINTGYCTVGNFGSDDRVDYTVIGGQVNLASRLESEAKEDEIFISYETFSLIKETIACEEVGKITVKGIAYPVHTYRVIDLVENLNDRHSIFKESINGFVLEMDLNQINDKEHVVAMLIKALGKIE
jgi:class 3 adenylate cyclase